MFIRRQAYKKTVSLVDETAVGIYESYVGNEKGFMLESYDRDHGRYVFIGRDPEAFVSSDKDRGIRVIYRDGRKEEIQGNPVDCIKEFYDRYQISSGHGDLPFAGGLVGSFGYDFVKYKEKLPDENPDDIGIETIQLYLVTSYIIMDLQEETMTFVTLADESEAEAAMENCEQTAAEVREAYARYIKEGRAGKPVINRDGTVTAETDTKEQYCRKVEKIKEYIRDGHIFQTVLSQRWTVDTGNSGFDLYRELRDLNPSPYMYYFNFGDFEIIGSSPEMIVQERGGEVRTCPIAGTRRRGSTKEDDARLEKELLADPKERAEHVMLVDLARNDMGRIARYGSVKVSRFMEIKKYSHVMHIVSLVTGRQKDTMHPVDLLNSFLPAGTLSGAPKIRAMEIIDELEEKKRGLYGGATGYIDFSGDMDFCITIRTMIKRGRNVYLQAGAGIVADSIPENEYEECRNKVRALATLLVEEA